VGYFGILWFVIREFNLDLEGIVCGDHSASGIRCLLVSEIADIYDDGFRLLGHFKKIKPTKWNTVA